MKILVWKGKHDTSYFDASTDEKKAKSALYLMQLMDQEGYYWEPTDPRESKYSGISEADFLTDEQIAALPNEALRESATKARTKYRNAMHRFASDRAMWEEGQRILTEKDVSVRRVKLKSKLNPDKVIVNTIIPAWDFIRNRADYEYENVYLEDVIDPDKDDE